MNVSKILVVDDEPEIIELMTLYLQREGYAVYAADNGTDALRLVDEVRPDLIVLDVLLKQLNGLDVCQQIREITAVPVLFVSAKSDDNDIIHGLSVGGDDYMTKPFSPGQLVARVKAHLRRQSLQSEQRDKPVRDQLVFDGLIIDLTARTVRVGDQYVSLSVKEFELLALLATQPNRAFQLANLYEAVWGVNSIGDTRTLMVHMSNLRKKIEPDPTNPRWIVTLRGVGYKFNVEEGNELPHVHR
ncbi:two component transcriptional regulator, winged helix family [Paenibacillus curdlanolyticus YK9]|uniref:Two component transcriptional regulator, winged helix family n=1 Tax=Paenibacillus curdlanolyticus YK9 TaxID=717606 RepID=E0I4X6_9BACL|nr:response regulator transcription factor [Paenibacillus curdlanolyticus]EFM12018.1 two component transcriptional regulator, winged helix family [Paenibacillus curdlanolyticus YK9]